MAAMAALIRRPALATTLTLAVLLLAFALRMHLLGAQSLWNDEGNSAVQAARPFTAILEHSARDIHPPGYYLALALWARLAGFSEFSLRALSAFASLLTVALAAHLGRRLYGRWAGVAAAALAALNTFAIYYAQEARMYALLALWAAAGFALLLALLERPSARRAALLAVITAAGLYTHYAYPLFMLAHGAAALAWLLARTPGLPRRRALLACIAAALAALALFLPWLPTALGQLSGWQQTSAAQAGPEQALALLLPWLALGLTAGAAGMAIPACVALFGLLARGQRPPDAARALLAPLWTALPLAAFLALGLARAQNYKFMLPAAAGAALWLAGGLWALWRLSALATARTPIAARRLALAGRAAALGAAAWLLLTLTASLQALYTDPALQRANYRGLAQDISAALQPGDAIILNAPNQAEVFDYYYAGAAPVYPLPAGLGGDDAAAQAAIDSLLRTHARAFVVLWGERERDPNRVIERTLNMQAYAAGGQWYGDVRLARYLLPARLAVLRQTDAQFGAIALERTRLDTLTLAAGGGLRVLLEWRALEPPGADYTVFVQLLDAQGRLIAQHDSAPANGERPTSGWAAGERIDDRHGLLLPAALPAGEYRLIAGLYPAGAPDQRLRTDADQDTVVLAQLVVR